MKLTLPEESNLKLTLPEESSTPKKLTLPEDKKEEKTDLWTDVKEGIAAVPIAMLGASGAVAKHIAGKDEERRAMALHRIQSWQDNVRRALGINYGLDVYGKNPGVGGNLVQAVPTLATAIVAPYTIPALAAGRGSNTATELEQSGVDRGVSNLVGTIDAASDAIGMAIPAAAPEIRTLTQLGKTALFGSSANVAQGMATRYLQKRSLEGRGYEEQAKRFENTPETIITEALLGGAPRAGVGVYRGRKLSQAERSSREKLDALESQRQGKMNEFEAGDPEGLDSQQPVGPQFGGKLPETDQGDDFILPKQAPTEQLTLDMDLPIPEKPVSRDLVISKESPKEPEVLPPEAPDFAINRPPERDISNMSLDEFESYRQSILDQNNKIESDFVRKHFGPEEVAEFEKKNYRERGRWLEKYLTVEQDNALQSSYKDQVFLDRVNDRLRGTDLSSAEEVGRSIFQLMRDAKNPDFRDSPDAAAIKLLLRHAADEGYNPELILDTARQNAKRVYGDDAEEILASLFKPAKAPEPEKPKAVTFKTAKGSTYQVHEDGTTTRDKAARPEHPGEQGVQPRSARTVYVTPEDAQKLDLIQTQGGGKGLAFDDDTGHVGVKYLSGPGKGKIERSTVVPYQKEPGVGLIPVESWGDSKTIHFGNKITEVGDTPKESAPPSRPMTQLGMRLKTEQPEPSNIPFLNTENTALQFKPGRERQDLKDRPPNRLSAIQKVRDELGIVDDVGPPKSTKESREDTIWKDVTGEKIGKDVAPSTVEDAVLQGKTSDDLPKKNFWKGNNALGAGIRMKGMVFNNPVIRRVNHVISEATNKAAKFMRDDVEPIAKSWADMTDEERTNARTMAQWADRNEEVLRAEDLRAAGYSEKVISFYEQYRSVLDKFYKEWNANRAAAGLDAVDYRYGYSPNNFKGDYTAVVTRDGKIVGVLTGKSLAEVEAAKKQVKKYYSDVHITNTNRRAINQARPGEFVKALQDIQKIIDGDPRLKDISEALRQRGIDEGKDAFNFDVHTLNKEGVFGNEGNKFWKNAYENNDDFFKSIVNYFEEGSLNHNMIQANSELKSLLGNPDVKPNTKQYLEDYKNYLDGRTSQLGGAVDNVLDSIANGTKHLGLGYGPNSVRAVNNFLINTFQTMKLASGSMRMLLAQMTQPLQTGLPMLMKNAKDLGIDTTPMEAGKQLAAGSAIFTAAYLDYKSGGRLTSLPDIYKEAFTYAKDRGLISWSEYEHIKSYGKTSSKLGKLSSAPLRFAEATTRPTMFFALFNQIVGQGYNPKQAMEIAYNRTQASMGDYHNNQKAMVYGNLGVLGRQMGQLKTYSHFSTNLYQYYWKEKDMNALGYQLATNFGLAGLKGFIGYDLASELYDWITGRNLTDDIKEKYAEWAGVKADSDAMDYLLYGPLSKDTGLWLQPSLSGGNIIPSTERDAWSFVFPSAGEAFKIGKNIWDFASDPGTQTAKNAVRGVIPSSLQGLWDVETSMDSQGRIKDKFGQPKEPALTEKDQMLKKYGLGLNTFDLGKKQTEKWNSIQKEQKRSERAKDLARRIKNDMVSQEFTREQLTNQLEEYAKITGDPNSVLRLLKSLPRESLKKHLTKEEMLLITGSTSSILKHQRLND